MRNLIRRIGGMVFSGALLISPAWADIRHIADDAALQAALAEGVTGDTLVLAPGRYGPIVLRGDQGSAPAVIRSADPANPAEITGLLARRFENLRLENLSLRYRFDPEDEIWFRPFDFRSCTGLQIISTRIEGDEAHGRDALSNGLPHAFGLAVTACRDVVIEGVHISRFFRGLVVAETSEIIVRRNELTALRMDGMNFSQVRNVVIEANHIHSFRRSTDPRDHADMIQFWTNGTEEPSRGITIRHNILNSGDGLYTQSIFMRNDLVDRGLAGPEMFYRDVLIEENVILNAHLHGISVGETRNLTIRHNTLMQNTASAGENPDRDVWVPTIRVSADAVRVEIADNLAASVNGFEGQSSWRVHGNVEIQNTTSLAPGFYGRVFTGMPGGDPTDLSNYRYRPDGEAAGRGAAWLRDN